MPNSMLKGSVKYCIENKTIFLILLIQIFIFECIFNKVGGLLKTTSLIVLFFILGYGLIVTRDVINGGKSLPKVQFKELAVFGLKGIIVYTFYLTIQACVLGLISIVMDFPVFDLEELLLEIGETVALFYKHDPISFIVFILLGLITVYVTIFFMEIALAILADGGKLREAFDFRKIRDIISEIGWNAYAIDYTKIILAVVILIAINGYFKPYWPFSILIGVVTDILAFLVEYRGIGNIYREYKEKHEEIENSS